MVLKGNHNAMALTPPHQSGLLGEAAAAWIHALLTNKHRQLLAALRLMARMQSCFLVHASTTRLGPVERMVSCLDPPVHTLVS